MEYITLVSLNNLILLHLIQFFLHFRVYRIHCTSGAALEAVSTKDILASYLHLSSHENTQCYVLESFKNAVHVRGRPQYLATDTRMD